MANPKNVFNGKPIRAQFYAESNEWLFSIVDVCDVLAASEKPRHYWTVLKKKLFDEGNEALTNCRSLKLLARDGKMRVTDVLNKDEIIAVAKRIRNSQHTAALIEWLESFVGASRKFTLKHKDVEVLEVELDSTGAISTFGKMLNEAHLPVGTVGTKGVDFPLIRDWWKGRAIPASRDGLRDLLDPLDIAFPQQLLDKSFGLSLSDHYWICPQNIELKWADINFFYNPFSEDVGNLLFRKLDWDGLDTSAISLNSPDNTSDGVLKKKWKIINCKRFLIKGGSTYNQEVANEVLTSRICKRLGIPFVNYEIIKLDGKQYSVCEDFINVDTELITAWHIMNLIKKDNSTSDYDSLIAKVEELSIVDVRRKIDMMLTLDFIIVNTDRHYNNFGFIRNPNTLEWLSVAPIYDSGTSMWCRELSSNINPVSIQIESKPFRSRHDKQIKLVKDFSWLNLDALDGVENEYAEILSKSVSDASELADRHKKLCLALRKRIELLKKVVDGK
ncbi:MAG: HipA domain-containing protein [Christensenellaceae bacterium]|jgi:hypothetical protein|nr:HipA domain-containing protein [Christensenellaceae bacterium]